MCDIVVKVKPWCSMLPMSTIVLVNVNIWDLWIVNAQAILIFTYDQENQVYGFFIFLDDQGLCSYISYVSLWMKEEARFHSLSISHLKLQPSTIAPPLHQMKIPMLIANITRVKLHHYLTLYCFTHICILSCVTN